MVTPAYKEKWEALHGRSYAVAHKQGARSKSRKRSCSRYAYRKSLGTKRGYAYEHIVAYRVYIRYDKRH